ncbi:hypothetical protein [Rhodanobacter soli]|uniref:hypothetical protein n=1 Tax=Rhodanobacter soli TaxID=590609 RepID=UPI0031D283A7
MQNSGSFDPTTLANPHWFSSGHNDSLYVEAYELALVPAVIPRKIFRFDEIVVLIKTAKLDYLEMAGVKIKFGKERQVEMSAEHRISTSEFSPKLITIQPHRSDRPDEVGELADRSTEYVSLLVSTNYRNIACRRLFTHIVGRGNSSMVAAGSLIRLPFDLPAPDLTQEALGRFPKCHGEIEKRSPNQKQKITLSLHWHLKGIQSDGLDSFLSLWIALETLAMTSTNIADLNSALAAVYNITRESASAEFGVGRIFGLRSQIVHNGIRKRISTDLTDYMECLYADLLVYELLGDPLGRARSLLSSKKIDIGQLTS